jgi:hypothetical protein
MEVIRLVKGCGLVLHFSGASQDLWPFEDIRPSSDQGNNLQSLGSRVQSQE